MPEEADNEFPEGRLVWPGCLLALIVHSVFVRSAPFLAHQHSWKDGIYYANNTQGCRAAVAFGPEKRAFVALIADFRSTRALSIGNEHEASQLSNRSMRGMPKSPEFNFDIVREYLSEDVAGAITPVITTAFWGGDATEKCSSSEAWIDVLGNGGQILQKQVVPIEDAIIAWRDDCELSEIEVDIVRNVFARRVAAGTGEIDIPDQIVEFLRNSSRDSGAFDVCLNSFSKIGIIPT